VNSSGVAVEEPISSELVLVDEELAQRARGALPEPPWLLPVLAELELEQPAQAVAVEKPSVPTAVAEPEPTPRRDRLISTPAVVVLLLLSLGPAAYLLYGFLPKPQGPTLAARPEATAPVGTLSTTPAATAKTAPAEPRAKSKPKDAPTRPKAPTESKPAVGASKRAAKPNSRPRAFTRAQRVFTWHRVPGAVYYQFYLQRGSKTVYQARTVRPTARLPVGLKVRPGTYRVLVRPAVASDAGIILGAAVLGKTVTI
jgi:hypothetical protein